jgi:hypothetical protein
VGDAIEMDNWAGADPTALTLEIANRMRSVSELAGLPPAKSSETSSGHSILTKKLITLAATWGRVTHKLPIRIARNLALRQSGDADQPAMLTMMFGIGLVLLTYFLQITVVGVLVRSFWITSLYLVSLVCGAYWAAFEKHPRN